MSRREWERDRGKGRGGEGRESFDRPLSPVDTYHGSQHEVYKYLLLLTIWHLHQHQHQHQWNGRRQADLACRIGVQVARCGLMIIYTPFRFLLDMSSLSGIDENYLYFIYS